MWLIHSMIIGLVIMLGALVAPAMAQTINQCDWPTQARNIVEPWEEATRTFANGEIRIAHVDTGGEPVCCSSHLLILAPDPQDEQGFRQCVTLSDGGTGMGFNWIEFKDIEADYDAAKGLRLFVPVIRYRDGGEGDKSTIRVRINQATGAITVE